MSYVATVLLVFKTDDREPEEVLRDANACFVKEYGADYPGLADLTAATGGTKHPQLEIAGGGFNYLDIPEFLTHLRSVNWGSRYAWADVGIQNENDNGMGWVRLYRGPEADEVGPVWSEAR